MSQVTLTPIFCSEKSICTCCLFITLNCVQWISLICKLSSLMLSRCIKESWVCCTAGPINHSGMKPCSDVCIGRHMSGILVNFQIGSHTIEPSGTVNSRNTKSGVCSTSCHWGGKQPMTPIQLIWTQLSTFRVPLVMQASFEQHRHNLKQAI